MALPQGLAVESEQTGVRVSPCDSDTKPNKVSQLQVEAQTQGAPAPDHNRSPAVKEWGLAVGGRGRCPGYQGPDGLPGYRESIQLRQATLFPHTLGDSYLPPLRELFRSSFFANKLASCCPRKQEVPHLLPKNINLPTASVATGPAFLPPTKETVSPVQWHIASPQALLNPILSHLPENLVSRMIPLFTHVTLKSFLPIPSLFYICHTISVFLNSSHPGYPCLLHPLLHPAPSFHGPLNGSFMPSPIRIRLVKSLKSLPFAKPSSQFLVPIFLKLSAALNGPPTLTLTTAFLDSTLQALALLPAHRPPAPMHPEALTALQAAGLRAQAISVSAAVS